MKMNEQYKRLRANAKEFLLSGLAIEPILVKNQGEMTKVIYDSEQVIIPFTTQRFVKELCHHLFLDLGQLQSCVKDKLCKKQLLPIPLSFQMVLVPLRIKQSCEIKTRGFLWIVHRQLKDLFPSVHHKNNSVIVLYNGYQITVPYTIQFVQQQLRDASLLDYMFQEIHLSPRTQRPTPINEKGLRDDLHQQLIQIAEAIRNYPTP